MWTWAGKLKNLSISLSESATADAAAAATQKPKLTRSFVKNALQRKQSFMQFFVMGGILLLSCRSVGQKYRFEDLKEDTAALKEESKELGNRMNNIKQGLFAEAALDPTGRFADRLRLLFGEGN